MDKTHPINKSLLAVMLMTGMTGITEGNIKNPSMKKCGDCGKKFYNYNLISKDGKRICFDCYKKRKSNG